MRCARLPHAPARTMQQSAVPYHLDLDERNTWRLGGAGWIPYASNLAIAAVAALAGA
jgi:hypothetical protein